MFVFLGGGNFFFQWWFIFIFLQPYWSVWIFLKSRVDPCPICPSLIVNIKLMSWLRVLTRWRSWSRLTTKMARRPQRPFSSWQHGEIVIVTVECLLTRSTLSWGQKQNLILRIQIIFYGRDAVLTVKFCILTADLHSKPYFTEVSLAFKKPTRSWGTHTSRLFNNVLILKYLLAEFSEWRFFVLSEDRLTRQKYKTEASVQVKSVGWTLVWDFQMVCCVCGSPPPQPPRPFGPVENYGLFHVKWPELKDTTAWFFLNVFFFPFQFLWGQLLSNEIVYILYV